LTKLDAARLGEQLSLPVIAAPMFLVSGRELVIACCREGVLGTFPAANAREQGDLGQWLEEIEETLATVRAEEPRRTVAPYGVNLIMRSPRLPEDLATTVAHRVPFVVASVGNPTRVVEQVHAYGGLVFADVATVLHAHKALATGVDGLILLCAGAGGNTGWLNPFAFVSAVRDFYDGPLVLAGGIHNGRSIRAAQVLGADYAYMGTGFIPTVESMAHDAYRDMLIAATADDVMLTTTITGIPSNMVRASLAQAGFFADIPEQKHPFYFQKAYTERKAWKDVRSAGHGVGEVREIESVSALVARLRAEYAAASQ
jgi:nitronate monooxygenase